jgi:ankyrin repeat protein
MAKCNTPADIFELMLSKGAEINIRDNSGKTPLDMAEAGGHTELVSYLISKGAKRNSELPPVKDVTVSESESIFDDIAVLQITIIALPLLLLAAAFYRKYRRKQ